MKLHESPSPNARRVQVFMAEKGIDCERVTVDIRGGENIYPREIEEYLFRHPKIQQAAVFGIPDECFGEAVVAWVSLNEGETASEDEIKAYCSEQIAYYKVPKHIVIVDEFPLTVTGKIQKFVMREKMMEGL